MITALHGKRNSFLRCNATYNSNLTYFKILSQFFCLIAVIRMCDIECLMTILCNVHVDKQKEAEVRNVGTLPYYLTRRHNPEDRDLSGACANSCT